MGKYFQNGCKKREKTEQVVIEQVLIKIHDVPIYPLIILMYHSDHSRSYIAISFLILLNIITAENITYFFNATKRVYAVNEFSYNYEQI